MSFLVIIAILLLLLLAGAPVFVALILAPAAVLFCLEGMASVDVLADVMYTSINNYLFVAIPLFTLMAQILVRTDAVRDLYLLCDKALKRLPGSLGLATISSCTVFSAVSGSSVATAMTVGSVSIPEMLRFGYPRKLVFGVVAAGGTLGILIPPSLALIVYGVIANVSIGSLFIAAVVPGIVLVSLFSLYFMIREHRELASIDVARGEDRPITRKQAWRAVGVLMLPLLIIGGIYGGVFSATEASAVSAIAATLIAFLLYDGFSVKKWLEAAGKSVEMSAALFLIVAGAMYFAHVLILLEVPNHMLQVILDLELGKYQFLAMLLALLFVLGMFLDGASITLITTPLVVPVLQALGFDLTWYGIVLVISMEMALITPPVGMNLFVIRSMTDAEFKELFLGATPFVLLMFAALLLVILFPGLALWLPGSML